MSNSTSAIRALTQLSVLAAVTIAPLARAADADEIAQLRAQLKALEQKLIALEHRQEVQDGRVAVADKGVTLTSADAAGSIKLRGLMQLDSRLFFGDGGGVVNNAFALRRTRLISEGNLTKNYSFQLVADFGGGTVTMADANFSVVLSPALQLKFGKFKEPIALERLQSDSWTFFNERSMATNLVPDRDLGVQASGELADKRVNYAVGVFNGLPDGTSSSNTDFDNEKDLAARVIVAPFRDAAGSPVQGLTFGIGGSVGRQKSAAGRTAAYRTDGQQAFFSYNANTVADGTTWRVSPQFDYRFGSFGAMGEYVVSTVNLRASAAGAKTELNNRAWQIAAGYVLTGEDSSYNGVTPRANFDWAAGAWGAFEVVGHYVDFKIDDAAFPLLASASNNADEARSLGLGLNWYLSKAIAIKFDYFQTKFGFSPLALPVPVLQILRQDEKALITRFQFSF